MELRHTIRPDPLTDPETTPAVATSALKRLDAMHAELKSMRNAPQLRGRGLGRAVLVHILAEARSQGFARTSLETGTTEAFVPAHGLYKSHGFKVCGPFGNCTEDPHCCFMSPTL